MLAKLIRRIKCCSVQEILMIVSIIMLLIVIANRDKSQIGRIRTNHTGPKDDRPPSRIENTLPALRPSSADRMQPG